MLGVGSSSPSSHLRFGAMGLSFIRTNQRREKERGTQAEGSLDAGTLIAFFFP
jgi:hypothetical protein